MEANNIRTIDEFGKVVIPRQLRIMHDLQTFRGTVQVLISNDNQLLLYSSNVSGQIPDGFKYKELSIDDFGRISVLSILGCLKKVQFKEIFDSSNRLEYIEVKPI